MGKQLPLHQKRDESLHLDQKCPGEEKKASPNATKVTPYSTGEAKREGLVMINVSAKSWDERHEDV
jgi:hypothetical protein